MSTSDEEVNPRFGKKYQSRSSGKKKERKSRGCEKAMKMNPLHLEKLIVRVYRGALTLTTPYLQLRQPVKSHDTEKVPRRCVQMPGAKLYQSSPVPPCHTCTGLLNQRILTGCLASRIIVIPCPTWWESRSSHRSVLEASRGGAACLKGDLLIGKSASYPDAKRASRAGGLRTLDASEFSHPEICWRCYNDDSPRVHCETRVDGSREGDRVPRY